MIQGIMSPAMAPWIGLLLVVIRLSSVVTGAQVPAMFVFGDSLVDPGNNNNLITLARADYEPYGIDFPAGATGRFCNGGTVVDYLGKLICFLHTSSRTVY